MNGICSVAWKLHLAHVHVFGRVVVGRVAHRTWKLRLKRLKPRQTVKESVYFEYDRIGTLAYILYFHLIGHTSSPCVDVW